MMKFSILVLFSVLSLASAAPTTPSQSPARSYIVKLKTHAKQSSFQSFLHSFASAGKSDPNSIKHTYRASFFNGVAGKFTDEFLEQYKKAHPNDIEYIEEDGLMYAFGSQASPPSWGLTRVSQRTLDLSKPFLYPDSGGEGVDVYIVDTGISPTHPDFEGRATMAKSFVEGEEAIDLNGHGTHVAGTIGSKTYGIAKKANLFGVKVLDAGGSGTYSDVIAGINFVAEKVRQGKTLINMSLGGPKAQSVDDAVVAAVKAGVVVIVAAGNSYGDACRYSPANVKEAVTVGATDNKDAMAGFSNSGSCVDISAPGVDIKSLWLGSNGETNTISGTSMATPHVVGVAALLMNQRQYSTPEEVAAELKKTATKDVITKVKSGTPNLLLFEDGTTAIRSDN